MLETQLTYEQILDGTVVVHVDGIKEALKYKLSQIADKKPNFLEFKGRKIEAEELTLFYDCEGFQKKQ